MTHTTFEPERREGSPAPEDLGEAATPVADFGDPHLYTSTDRYAMWAAMSAADRVAWTEPGSSPGGFWSVFSHKACSQVLAPQAPFTSEHGMMIGFDAEHSDSAGGRMLVVTDGDRHTQLRRVIGPFLSRSKAASLNRFIEAETRTLIGLMRDQPTVDVAATIGPRIPAAAVCEILGVPVSDRELLVNLTNHAFAGADTTFDEMTPSEAHAEILLYFDELIDERRKQPREDLISTLLQEESLTPDDVLMNCDNVLIGGNETTRHAVTGCFHAAADTPGFLPALAADPDLTGTAVDELIRWTSPAMHVLRVATDDVTVGGQKITRGSAVAAWLPAANRDLRMFDSPEEFDASRRPNRHLGFGVGTHHCLGAALARVELTILLRVLTETVTAVGLQEQPSWLCSNLVQGYRTLQATVDWRTSRSPSS
ncbi:cytochrome P450 [Streptomyces sp. NPDC048301]|uniref:cytochrome P450 n=1 Tax=Streptomyces sp. NPDC048301 TaxID=3155631 RepID=UPI0034360164